MGAPGAATGLLLPQLACSSQGRPIGSPSSRRRMLKEGEAMPRPYGRSDGLGGFSSGDRAATSGMNFKATPFMQ
jgi:hypothetical protein